MRISIQDALFQDSVSDIDEACMGFLKQIRNDGKPDDKRYLGSPLRYVGGKSLAVGYIIERFPTPIAERIVDIGPKSWTAS